MLHWILLAIAASNIVIGVLRLTVWGGIPVYGYYPFVWIFIGLVCLYYAWANWPRSAATPLAPMTAGRRRRGGRW